jgi:hypothetical protein
VRAPSRDPGTRGFDNYSATGYRIGFCSLSESIMARSCLAQLFDVPLDERRGRLAAARLWDVTA